MRDSLCGPCAEHFAAVRALLDQEGIPYTLNPRLVRGLDYYVRTAFEIVSEAEDLGAQNAIGGGGRYDGLVAKLGGPDVPGIGFALGLDRLAMATGAPAESVTGPVAVILPLETRAVGPALRLATRLRDEGLAVDVEPAGRSLKALLGVASRRRARLAVILGADELAAGRATVRNLVSNADRRQALDLDAPGAELARWVRAEGAA
jgi:histidyl-tRNA synthetase